MSGSEEGPAPADAMIDLTGRAIKPAPAPSPLPPENNPLPTPSDTGSTLQGGFNLQAALKNARIVMPMSSYHMNSAGQHVAGYNEHNPGIGLSIPLTDATKPGPTLNLELGSYVNSYANPNNRFTGGRFAGDRTHYVALSSDLVRVDVAGLRASLGVMAGVATTDRGSYAATAPKFSSEKNNLTAMAMMTAKIEHRATGLGLQAMILPPSDKKTAGFVGLALTKKLSL